jgi:hypothetical protein
MKGDENGGDSEKFAGVDDWDGIVVTVDDDILYPRDYVDRIREGLETWGADHAVGFHGGVTRLERLPCHRHPGNDPLPRNPRARRPRHQRARHGAMGFHAGHVPIWRDVFRYPNMADVQFATHARALGVPMVCLSHRERWLRTSARRWDKVAASTTRTATGTVRAATRAKTATAKSGASTGCSLRRARPLRPCVVSTCERPDLLRQLLDDLKREAAGSICTSACSRIPTGPATTSCRSGWCAAPAGNGTVRPAARARAVLARRRRRTARARSSQRPTGTCSSRMTCGSSGTRSRRRSRPGTGSTTRRR